MPRRDFLWPCVYDALVPKHEFAGSSLRWIPKRVGFVIILMCGVVGGLHMVLLQLKEPLETIREEN